MHRESHFFCSTSPTSSSALRSVQGRKMREEDGGEYGTEGSDGVLVRCEQSTELVRMGNGRGSDAGVLRTKAWWWGVRRGGNAEHQQDAFAQTTTGKYLCFHISSSWVKKSRGKESKRAKIQRRSRSQPHEQGRRLMAVITETSVTRRSQTQNIIR